MSVEGDIELRLKWIQENAGEVEDVEKRIDALRSKYKDLSEIIRKANVSDKQRQALLKQTANKIETTAASVAKLSPANRVHLSMMQKIRDAEEKFNAEQGKMPSLFQRGFTTLGKLSGRVNKAGKAMSWFGFRIMMVGWQLQRWFMAPIRAGTKLLTGWEQNMDDIATSMGYLAASGMLTAEMQEYMTETMVKNLEEGMAFSGALGLLKTVFTDMASTIGGVLTPYIIDLATTLRDVWEQIEPTLIPALKELMDKIMPEILNLIEEMGPALIEGFVEGIKAALPLIIQFMKFLTPLAPVIGQVIGFIAPFTPLIMALGTALMVVGPIIQTVSLRESEFRLEVCSLLLHPFYQ